MRADAKRTSVRWSSVLLAWAFLFASGGFAAADDLQLVEAVKTRNFQNVPALLRQTTDVNATQGDGATALHWAALRIAADLGVDVNAANSAGETAMHGAAVKGFNAVISFLGDRDAKVDVKNKAGKTPLAIALEHPSSPVTIDFDATAHLLRKLGAAR